jgi:tetratricopeptide (TPR) repeat protein
MKLKLYTLLIGTVFLFSCKTAQKLYQRGQYDEAVELAAKKLSKKPHDIGLLTVLQDAYRYAVQDHESRIRNLSNSNTDLRWEQIYHEYTSLQRLYDAIRRSPSVYDIVQPTDYASYLTSYKEQAGNAREDRGDELMNQNTKSSFRQAYYEYQKALSLKPGDLTIKQKMDDAYANAVTNIAIMPLTRFGIQYSQYRYDYDDFDYQLLRYVNDHRSGPFIRFFGDNDRSQPIDIGVEMRFSDVNIGRYRDERSVREVSKQVVSKEIVHKPDSITREYITVKARITTTTRTLKANAILQAIARDMNNRHIWSDTYRGDYSWVYSFATYTGDERALSDEDKKLLTQKEQWPASNDEIIRIIMNEIRQKAQCGISDFFNRYN